MKTNRSPLQLRNLDAANLFEALRALDAAKLAPDGGRTRYAIARNLRRLSEIGEAIDAVRNSLDLESHAGQKAWSEFLQKPLPETVELFPIDWATLQVDENDLKPSRLYALLPILTGGPEGMAAES